MLEEGAQRLELLVASVSRTLIRVWPVIWASQMTIESIDGME